MILCLDIGNTHIYGGVFADDILQLRFRYVSQNTSTSDQFGLFLKNVLRENDIDPNAISAIALSSVVPSLDYSITAACIKYFKIDPLLVKPGIKTGINLQTKNPVELGADRIANAVACVEQFKSSPLIVIDFGTATTLCAISDKAHYIGGAILPGIKIAMEALHQQTAKLAPVNIVTPEHAIGKTTEQNIQSGLYYSQLGAIKELITRFNKEYFQPQKAIVIATGGYSHLFEHEQVFDAIIPDLVLHGLRLIWQKNSATVS